MGFQTIEHATLVDSTSAKPGQTVTQLALYLPDGTQHKVPKMAAAQTDSPALTSAAATGGDAPTEAEYNALRTDVSNVRTTLNSLLGKLRTASTIAP